jgi:prephenate dehydrogenase
MPADRTIDRLVVIGLGLIGGSLALQLKKAGAVNEIVGVARTEQTLRRALELGVVDAVEEDLARAVRGADVVVVATPVQTIAAMFERLAPVLDASTIITDVGSVKGFVVAAARRHLGVHLQRFVPAHPIAGTENSGVEAAFAELYRRRHVIITPVAETERGAVDRIAAMWRDAGAEVMELPVQRHDELLASTSHLPHVVAYALVNYLASRDEADALFDLAAGGFYDFTRIASSDAVMWRDICLTNRDAITKALKGFEEWVARMREAVETGDGERLQDWFEHARDTRDRGLQRKADNQEP